MLSIKCHKYCNWDTFFCQHHPTLRAIEYLLLCYSKNSKVDPTLIYFNIKPVFFWCRISVLKVVNL